MNLENPIFVFYINVEGLPLQKVEEHIGNFIEDNKNESFNSIYIPIQKRILMQNVFGKEHLWKNLKNNFLDTIYDMFDKIDNLEDFKKDLRNIKLGQIM